MTDARPGREDGGRYAMVVAAGILVSRVVGLLRNTVFAHYFGAGLASDSYNAAFKIPNAMRNLLGEGTLSAAFVPVYSAALGRGDERGARALANAVLGLLMAVVSALTLLGIVAAPWLTTLLAPGFDADARELTTRLVRILFPMTAVMVLSGWCLGIQNSHKRFFWSYASAAFWSIAQIALLLVWGPRADSAASLAVALAWATLVGAALQVAGQWPEVRRVFGVVRPTLDRQDAGVRQILRHLVPVLTALGVVQLSSFVDLQIASYLPVGATTTMTYANTLALLPVSLFGVSVAAAALPDLSRDSSTMAFDVLRERLRAGWQRILFYVVPSALAFVVVGDYCVGLLYRSGQFGAAEQQAVHVTLAAYAVGLVSFGSVKLLGSVHYALQDYRTPLRASLLSIVVSAAAAASLAYGFRSSPLAVAGIALGSALGSYANLAVQVRGLRARLGPLYTPAMWKGTGRIVVAAVAAALVGGALRFAQHHYAPGWHPRIAAWPVLGGFALTYLLTAWALGSREASRWLRLAPRAAREAAT